MSRPTCSKCRGAGWIWGSGLEVDPDHVTDQRYTCDACVPAVRTDSRPGTTPAVRMVRRG